MLVFLILIALVASMEQSSLVIYSWTIEGVPFNFVEITLGIGCVGLFLTRKNMTRRLPRALTKGCGPALCFFVLACLYGFVHGYGNRNSFYEISRDFRPAILLAASYILAVLIVRTDKLWNVATALIVIGGMFALVRTIVTVAPIVSQVSHYFEARRGTASAGTELAVAFVFAAIVMNYPVVKSRLGTWALLVIGFVGSLLTFSVTAFMMLAILPIIALVFAPMKTVRKVAYSAVFATMLAVMFTGVAVQAGPNNRLETFGVVFEQILDQLRDFDQSAHYGVRTAAWSGTIESLDGLAVLTGKGLGTRTFIDTELVGPGGAMLIEATYAQYLNYIGLIGLGTLIWINLHFVLIGAQSIRTQLTPYQRTMVLAITVYGVVNVINGVLHNNLMSPLNSVLYGTLMGLVTVANQRNGATQIQPGTERSNSFAARDSWGVINERRHYRTTLPRRQLLGAQPRLGPRGQFLEGDARKGHP